MPVCRVSKHRGIHCVELSLCIIVANAGDLETCSLSGLFNSIEQLFISYFLNAGNAR